MKKALLALIFLALPVNANYYQIDPSIDPSITVDVLEQPGISRKVIRVQDLNSRDIYDITSPNPQLEGYG